MKYLYLIEVACITFATSCNSNQGKAEGLIKTYLTNKLKDPKSYESVSFSPLTKMKDTVVKMYDGQLNTVA